MNKNVILIGVNGSGKTTLSKMLYKEGYHILKLSPLSDEFGFSVKVPQTPLKLVFDRWSVTDRIVYAEDSSLLNSLTRKQIKNINKYNHIIYLAPGDIHYKEDDNEGRVVNRPPAKYRNLIVDRYHKAITECIVKGINIQELLFRGSVEEDFQRILKYIRGD